ncbi:hypothetical protein M0R45_012472 [Rubus argutus]|uniref:Uncharacterized protein n=1 Tax=Rubus argutus TaxID=59490 RepID=A0AAW1YEQ4_RUBAR
MLDSAELELPDCLYATQPTLIRPSTPTPKHCLPLSNLDDQKFLRFSIKYLYLFKKSVDLDAMKYALSKLLVLYYPLAGRLRTSSDHDQKLEVDCNGEGAVFAEASWISLLTGFLSFRGSPTGLGRNSCTESKLSLSWIFLLLLFRLQIFALVISCPHPQFTVTSNPKDNTHVDVLRFLQSQPLVPVSLTFAHSHILNLKRQCVPSLKCTTFEALASHTWRSWVRSLDLSPSLNIKLLFSVNVRRRLNPEIPKLIMQAKAQLCDDYVRSMIDLLEDKTVKTDLSASLVISQWAKLGLEELDFGEGKALHMGPVTSDVYCLFLPVIGDSDAVRVLVSVPERVAEKFGYYMTEFLDKEINNGDDHRHAINGYHIHAANNGIMEF